MEAHVKVVGLTAFSGGLIAVVSYAVSSLLPEAIFPPVVRVLAMFVVGCALMGAFLFVSAGAAKRYLDNQPLAQPPARVDGRHHLRPVGEPTAAGEHHPPVRVRATGETFTYDPGDGMWKRVPEEYPGYTEVAGVINDFGEVDVVNEEKR